ncbi:hypothetical protein [Oceanobacillus neutriphilus]|uniref:Uncharacterized protein n=1 Tax=Oceanobacillus neutriphilus TaxID=531815 RepID=A0ABQ2P228_9BACI|nr:hypothetical protein [Oceanobacillus neutriphilus]GGP16340.1 hypothetical protein GCM10011346_47840 [Oceanobacillus neutriphilus]
MDQNVELEVELEKKKFLKKLGCLAWGYLLIFGPFILVAAVLFYQINFKEDTLLTSTSPKQTNTIEIVEKGEAFFLKQHTIRVKYEGEHVDTEVNNGLKSLNESNANVRWIRDNKAEITLKGDGGPSNIIIFDAEASPYFVIEEVDEE